MIHIFPLGNQGYEKTHQPNPSNIYSYLCPDYLAGFDFDNSIGKIDDKMEEAGWLTPHAYVGGAFIRGQGNYKAMYSKLFDNSGTDANSPT